MSDLNYWSVIDPMHKSTKNPGSYGDIKFKCFFDFRDNGAIHTYVYNLESLGQ
jgi:hypothetical protein